MKKTNFIESAFLQAQEILESILKDNSFTGFVDKAGQMLSDAFLRGNHVYSCGNGGSLCDAIHFAEELTGRFAKDRRPLPATAIADPAHLSCVGNDYNFDQVFSRHLDAFGKSGDILLAITTSGKSPNVLSAIKTAKSKKMDVIGLLGKGGGIASDLVDIPLIVPSNSTHRIQEVHIKLIHILIEAVERRLFPELY